MGPWNLWVMGLELYELFDKFQGKTTDNFNT